MNYLNQRPKVHRLSRRAMNRPLGSLWNTSAKEALASALRWQYRSSDPAWTREIVEAWQDWWDRVLAGAKRADED